MAVHLRRRRMIIILLIPLYRASREIHIDLHKPGLLNLLHRGVYWISLDSGVHPLNIPSRRPHARLLLLPDISLNCRELRLSRLGDRLSRQQRDRWLRAR